MFQLTFALTLSNSSISLIKSKQIFLILILSRPYSSKDSSKATLLNPFNEMVTKKQNIIANYD